MAPIGRNTSTAAAASAPSITKGKACTSRDPRITKNVDAQAMRPGSATRRTRALAASIAATAIAVRGVATRAGWWVGT